ncbi:MAG: hypothetical protein WAN34_06365, partial [Acidimicrobiia bacterium]
MRSLKLLAVLAVFAMIVAACGGGGSGDTTTTAASSGETTTTAMMEETTTTEAMQAGDLGVIEVAAGDPIKIASLQSISGDTASLGTDQVRAVELAIKDKGEIDGHPIE